MGLVTFHLGKLSKVDSAPNLLLHAREGEVLSQATSFIFIQKISHIFV
jgi:hypothetical protein